MPPVPAGCIVLLLLLLLLQIFWSATFMAVPDLLLQMDQFSGWMMCLHQAMRKPLPWVSDPLRVVVVIV
jgi:hypothetical protein